MRSWRELLIAGEPGEIEARMRRHDGIFRWFLIRFEPFRDETGKIAMWYGVSADIEDLKQSQERLREDERELRQITDAIPQAVVVLDPSGMAIYANRATLDYTGLTADDVIAPNFRERLFHPEDIEKNRNERNRKKPKRAEGCLGAWSSVRIRASGAQEGRPVPLVPDSIQSFSKRARTGYSMVCNGHRH